MPARALIQAMKKSVRQLRWRVERRAKIFGSNSQIAVKKYTKIG